MTKLIILALIFVGYLLHEWWKARQAQSESQDEPEEPWPGQSPRPSRPVQPPPPTRTTSGPAGGWEEELRRLLQGEAPASPPPPTRPTTVRLPAPPPLLGRGPLAPPAMARPAPVRRQEPLEDPDMQKGLPVRMPTLEKSAQAYLRASQLESSVAERLRRIQERVVTHPKFEIKKEIAPEVRQALALLRERSTQRTAIIVSVVLGPPRALEG